MRLPIIDPNTGNMVESGAYSVGGGGSSDPLPVSIYICNISSVVFYILQFGYAIYLLYRLIFVNERSPVLISATLMLLFSSVCLGILFALSNLSYD